MKVLFSFPLLLVYALLIALWLVQAGRRKIAMVWIGGLAVAVYLLCTPLMTYGLTWIVGEHKPLQDPAALRDMGAEAIVIAGGGRYRHPETAQGREVAGLYSLARVRYGAELARMTGLPVLVTGIEAEGMARSLRVDYGQVVRWIEPASRNTAENARFSARLLLPGQARRIVLVTDAWHMERARRAFEGEGFEVIPAPTSFPLGFVEGSPPLLVARNDLFLQNLLGLTEVLGQVQYRFLFRESAPAPVPAPDAGPGSGS